MIPAANCKRLLDYSAMAAYLSMRSTCG